MVRNENYLETYGYIEAFYTDSLINKIGVETQFNEGTVETNLEFRFAPIKPYVEFVKRLDANKVSSTKFEFHSVLPRI